MVPVASIPVFVGIAVAVLLGLVLFSAGRVRRPQTRGLPEEDWAGNMLVWLLVLAAFVTGAFVSYALLRP